MDRIARLLSPVRSRAKFETQQSPACILYGSRLVKRSYRDVSGAVRLFLKQSTKCCREVAKW
jgi:hypothetical protein